MRLGLLTVVFGGLLAGTAQARDYRIAQHVTAAADAFRSLDEFARHVPCVKGGDRVLLRAGERYAGRMALRACTEGPGESAPVVVTSERARPGDLAGPAEIVAAAGAAAWGRAWERVKTPPGGVPLYRLGPVPGTAEPVQLYLRGAALTPARHPNRGVIAAARISKRSAGCAAGACFSAAGDAALAPLRAVTGGVEVVVRNSPWSYLRSPLAWVGRGGFDFATRDSVVTRTNRKLDDAASDFLEPGWGFSFVNDRAFIDRAGEWSFDPAARYLYLGADAPPALEDTQVALASGDDRFENAALGFDGGAAGSRPGASITIDGVAVRMAAGPGIFVFGADGVTVRGVRVEAVESDGIFIRDSVRAAVTAATVIATANGGITVLGARARPAARVRIEGNTIARAGQMSNARRLNMADLAGIRVAGAREAVVRGNRISDVGYAGIHAAEPEGEDGALTLEGNVVDRFCLALNDCGGIYVTGLRRDPGAVAAAGKRITGNVIVDGRGNLEGLPPASPGGRFGHAVERFIVGVYLDQGASHYRVTGNTVCVDAARKKGKGLAVQQVTHWWAINGGRDNGQASLARDNTYAPDPAVCRRRAEAP